MGDAALHLDLFEQPMERRVFQQPADAPEAAVGNTPGPEARLGGETLRRQWERGRQWLRGRIPAVQGYGARICEGLGRAREICRLVPVAVPPAWSGGETWPRSWRVPRAGIVGALACALIACGATRGSVPAGLTLGAGPAAEIPSPEGAIRSRPVVPSTGAAPAPPQGSVASMPAPHFTPPNAPRPPRLLAQDFTRGNRWIQEVALTFDGHDLANVAGEILEILKAGNIRVTMFLGGQFIRRHPEVVRRMLEDGHEVGNHMDTHPHLTSYAENGRHATRPGVTREAVTSELRRAEASFQALTDRAMVPYWRAPYGEHNAEIRAWAAETGYRHVGWTHGAGTAEDLDTRDWVADRGSHLYRTRAEVASRLLAFGQKTSEGLNGGIILMHLGSLRTADRPHEELPLILQSLQAQGYRLVTVSTLLEHTASQYADLPPRRPPSAE
jgi:peptidoglycan/xylan/chitin deacetylase (PgdA/CDA1 family)